ncbi:condensin-2 complex subunit G2 [Achlya hypogyna]|uniref:Condensin-2 complex subunit G2 n=1 Tax=Achlya hypogyna TaxID=1202772 RepID=A0A1V9ZJ10_ACHHY|nr:condensin-2 complex subunit G2 [Achlya hypogyna]
MRPELRRGLAALEADGACDALLKTFYDDCSGDTDTMVDWVEWLETLSSSQLLALCGSLPRATSVDLWTIASFTALIFEHRESCKLAPRVQSLLGDVIAHLHDQLMQTTCTDTQDVLAKLCEAFWVSSPAGAERVVTQLLPYLLVRALESDSHQSISFIKRLSAVQDALQLLDFEDDSSRLLKDLLLRCFVTPTFLKSSEGIAFLGDLFQIDVSFVDEIHQTIRNQIPSQRKSVVKRYGLVYYQAWLTAATQPESSVLVPIEDDCIQPLFHAATVAATTTHFNAVRALLQPFFEHKKHTDEMLYRLTEPILWRALHAANDVVRHHAAVLLFDGFPYQDPGFLKVDLDACLQRQFDAFSMLLEDLAPSVRVVAVHGICKVLSMYWELLPSDTIRKCLLKCFELSHDSSSHSVRVAVFDGLLVVLENHLSHHVLKPLLPQLAPLIHDTNEKVRAAMARLLVRIKSIRHLHFYDVVAIDACFRRLELDKGRPAVAKPLTELFMNSYFPQGAPGSSQVARALSLIEKHPHASIVFYRHVHHFASIGSVCKLVVLLFKCLVEDVVGDNGPLLCDVMCTLLDSIVRPLYNDARYKDCVAFLAAEIPAEAIATVFAAGNGPVTARLWHVVANLPPLLQEDLIYHALTQLESFTETSCHTYLAGILRSLQHWGQLPTFLDTLVESLQSQSDVMDPVLVIACLDVIFCSDAAPPDWPSTALTTVVLPLADALERAWDSLEPAVLPRLVRVLFALRLQHAVPDAKALVAEYKKSPVLSDDAVVFPFLEVVPPTLATTILAQALPVAGAKRKRLAGNDALVTNLLPTVLEASWICATQLFAPASRAFLDDVVALAARHTGLATQLLLQLWTSPAVARDADSTAWVDATTGALLPPVLHSADHQWLLDRVHQRSGRPRFWSLVLDALDDTALSLLRVHVPSGGVWKPLLDAAIARAALDGDSARLESLLGAAPAAAAVAKSWLGRQASANLEHLPPHVCRLLQEA